MTAISMVCGAMCLPASIRTTLSMPVWADFFGLDRFEELDESAIGDVPFAAESEGGGSLPDSIPRNSPLPWQDSVACPDIRQRVLPSVDCGSH
jgi:hypothetical protein